MPRGIHFAGMDTKAIRQEAFTRTASGMDESEDMTADVDEPPEERHNKLGALWSESDHIFSKANPRMFERRESLLTRQLHSETEHTDDDPMDEPPRALSTMSAHSVQSTTSTAELTSDDGHSMPSPTTSPPLPPTLGSGFPSTTKLSPQEPKILRADGTVLPAAVAPTTEKSVEENLGRKRCISFACGGNAARPPTTQPQEAPKKVEPQPAVEPTAGSPMKRKCSLKFVCPTRPTAETKPATRPVTPPKRSSSPPPTAAQTPVSILTTSIKASHRDSTSTIRHLSPKATRRSPPSAATTPTATKPSPPKLLRKYSNDSNDAGEATRFHEFASSDDEPEEWCQESTAYRSRLTVNDTLKKENIIRKACEEVEQEEEEEAEDEDDDDEDDVQLDDDEDVVDEDDDDLEDEEDEEDDDISDDGFRTDDEQGFAASDSEGEDSDADWWTPGGLSTAATSVEHMERAFSQMSAEDLAAHSSLGSNESDHAPRHKPSRPHRRQQSHAVPIQREPDASDLPDSTDFVCGTLDEDRPVEQAFLDSMKQREAAKHKARPQDIDPTFPTSDPEMDEEDDEDLELADESATDFMHGDMDNLHGDQGVRRRSSQRNKGGRSSRSPAPAPRKTVNRSPKPPIRRNTRSPPPPQRLRSPAPTKAQAKKLFGHSPKRARSPAPTRRMVSPMPTRRVTPTGDESATNLQLPVGLATRPPLVTYSSSLPRGGSRMINQVSTFQLSAADGDDDDLAKTPTQSSDLPKRGAIDIVKGLEKKRQRRKEKLYQKACAKAAAKGDKAYKVKPGKGAERMREVGLELQRYRGKGEHIISM